MVAADGQPEDLEPCCRPSARSGRRPRRSGRPGMRAPRSTAAATSTASTGPATPTTTSRNSVSGRRTAGCSTPRRAGSSTPPPSGGGPVRWPPRRPPPSPRAPGPASGRPWSLATDPSWRYLNRARRFLVDAEPDGATADDVDAYLAGPSLTVDTDVSTEAARGRAWLRAHSLSMAAVGRPELEASSSGTAATTAIRRGRAPPRSGAWSPTCARAGTAPSSRASSRRTRGPRPTSASEAGPAGSAPTHRAAGGRR